MWDFLETKISLCLNYVINYVISKLFSWNIKWLSSKYWNHNSERSFPELSYVWGME